MNTILFDHCGEFPLFQIYHPLIKSNLLMDVYVELTKCTDIKADEITVKLKEIIQNLLNIPTTERVTRYAFHLGDNKYLGFELKLTTQNQHQVHVVSVTPFSSEGEVFINTWVMCNRVHDYMGEPQICIEPQGLSLSLSNVILDLDLQLSDVFTHLEQCVCSLGEDELPIDNDAYRAFLTMLVVCFYKYRMEHWLSAHSSGYHRYTSAIQDIKFSDEDDGCFCTSHYRTTNNINKDQISISFDARPGVPASAYKIEIDTTVLIDELLKNSHPLFGMVHRIPNIEALTPEMAVRYFSNMVTVLEAADFVKLIPQLKVRVLP